MGLRIIPVALIPSALNQPVAHSMRQIEYLLPENSLERAADLLRETGAVMAPVLNGNGLGGVGTQASVAGSLAKSGSLFDTVETGLESVRKDYRVTVTR